MDKPNEPGELFWHIKQGPEFHQEKPPVCGECWHCKTSGRYSDQLRTSVVVQAECSTPGSLPKYLEHNDVDVFAPDWCPFIKALDFAQAIGL